MALVKRSSLNHLLSIHFITGINQKKNNNHNDNYTLYKFQYIEMYYIQYAN